MRHLRRRHVRCSPRLASFIRGHTMYKEPVWGSDPQAALRFLLRSCFVCDGLIFNDSFSPYQLLCSSQMILDMPAGYIDTWPPREGDAGL